MTEDREIRIESEERARWRRKSTRDERYFFSGRRQLEIWGLIVLLAVFVWAAVWDDWSTIPIFALVAAWIVYALHHSLTAVLHEMHDVLGELYELNDQITGRREQFRQVVHSPPSPSLS